MRVKKSQIFPFCNIVISVLLFLLDNLSPLLCVIYALITALCLLWITLRQDTGRLSFSTAILLYTLATQFGLVIPYFIFGAETAGNYSQYTLRFLSSPYLSRSILLGIVAVGTLTFGVQTARARYGRLPDVASTSNREVFMSKDTLIARYGVACLVAVLLYFAFHIATGGMKLFGSYNQFRESTAYASSLYSYVLILFYVGTVYLAAAGRIKDNLKGWSVWLFLVCVFALNGNKGEFLYALLAVLGMKGIQGSRLSWKLLAAMCLLVFVAIPSITALRGIGIAQNLSMVSFNPFEAFTEMGMQIRTSIYTLDLMEQGIIEPLHGRSYWQPIVNILTPFLEHKTATSSIRITFREAGVGIGLGFTQVIESYVNFGVVGDLMFFGLIGVILGKYEARCKDRYALAYLGTITSILINATRNYFAFVPGQILIVSVIYFVFRKTRFRKGGLS